MAGLALEQHFHAGRGILRRRLRLMPRILPTGSARGVGGVLQPAGWLKEKMGHWRPPGPGFRGSDVARTSGRIGGFRQLLEVDLGSLLRRTGADGPNLPKFRGVAVVILKARIEQRSVNAVKDDPAMVISAGGRASW